MLRSMYTATGGLKSQQTKMDVIGNNIANVNTVGFKQGEAYFKEMLSQDMGASAEGAPFNRQVGLGTMIGAIDTKFTQGALQTTGRDLDFAIEGSGFFTVITPDKLGDPETGLVDYGDADQVSDLLYTREGIFSWNADGYLVTTDGNYVLGQDGTTIRMDETVGNPAGAVQVSTVLQMATFLNPAALSKGGSNNYSNTAAAGAPNFGASGTTVTDASGAEMSLGAVRSGFLEMSNVDLANEFTNMIITSRAYQSNSRVITKSDEMLQELTNLVR